MAGITITAIARLKRVKKCAASDGRRDGLFSSVQIREANDQNDARCKKQNFGSGFDNSEQHGQLHRPAVYTN